MLNKKTAFNVLILVVFFITGCGKGDPYSGRLKEDTTWSGKILLTGDVYVESGVKLTILENTLIRYSEEEIEFEIQKLRDFSGITVDLFSEDKIELIISGDLDIRGTEKEPVIFKAPKNNRNRAGGINFVGSKSTSSIENLIMHNGYIGVRLYDYRAPKISSITVKGMAAGGIGCWDRSAPIINMSVIEENKYGIGASDLAAPVIKNSRIKNNSASGVFFEGQSTGRLINSEVKGNNVGVACGYKSEPQIVFNRIKANGSGIGCWEETTPQVEDNYFSDNLVGLLSLEKTAPKIYRNKFNNNGSGITATDNSTSDIANNEFNDNGPGILVKNKSLPNISENIFRRNRYGIRVENWANPVVKDNFFKENEVGFLFTDYSDPEYGGNLYEKNRTDTVDSRL